MSGSAKLGPGSLGLWVEVRRRIMGDWLTALATGILLLLVALAVAADVLSSAFFHFGFSQQDLLNAYSPPDLNHPALWLGSDDLGRSQAVRLLYGARVSLGVGFGAAFINLTLGLGLGLAAGYWRGWLDDVVQWLVATLESIPRVFLLLLIAVLFRPGPVQLIVVLGLLSWPVIALFIRGQTFSLRGREFVVAARVSGAGGWRIVARHILPNVLPLAAVLTAIEAGSLILTESALSFLGLGIQPPTPSWGNMLSAAASGLSRGPWLVWGPGAVIFITVLCLYLVGDGLRDALDPRLSSGVGR